MKTLKSAMMGIALLFVCVAANATTKPAAEKMTKDDVIRVYTDAVANGKTSDLDRILDSSMQFNMQRGDNTNTLNKDEFISSVKNAVPDPSVKATSNIMQDDDNSAMVKVEFKYDGFTRTDMVTLQNSAGWVVTKVDSSFK